MKRLLPLLTLAFIVAGCQNEPAKTPAPSDPGKTATTTGSTGSTPTPPANTPRREDVPATLKTAAFEHYGLGRETSPTMELNQPGGANATGAMKNELVAIEGEVAKYKQTWTGGLSYLGSTELEVRADGVYAVSLNENKLAEPQMELPADMATGKSWTGAGKVQIEGASIDSTTTKVIGPKKVKTKAGEFDAVAVSATVKGTRDKKPLNLSMTAYYVKGIGPVRVEMTTPDPKGKPISTVLQIVEKP